MAFKRKVDGNGEQFKFENIGDSLTGVYLGSLDHEGNYGPTKKHLFKTEKGVKVVFGQKHLSDMLEGERTGTLMRITFESEKKGKKGNPMKMYTLDIDDEYLASDDEVAAGVQEATTEENEDYEDNAEEEVVTRTAKGLPTGKAPDAAKQARVAALLSGRK